MNQKQFRKKVGPYYRKYVRPLIVKRVSNSKIKKFQNDNDSGPLRLVGIMSIYNESKNGNLERALNHLSEFCDDIVIYDDGSTDNSCEIASKYTKHIIRSSVNDFRAESSHRQKLIELALTLKPHWILTMDCDEVYDKNGENFGIRALCEYGQTKDIEGFSFLEYNLWKSDNHCRVDGPWSYNWNPALWKNTGKLKIVPKYGLHQLSCPVHSQKKIYRTEIKLIHYGFSTTEKINARYDRYKKNKLEGWDLERVRNEKGLELKPFSKDWFPLSTQNYHKESQGKE